MRWTAALRTAQKIAVGAHSICARKVYRAGNAPGGYGIRPYILFLPAGKNTTFFIIFYLLSIISKYPFIKEHNYVEFYLGPLRVR